MMLRHPEKSHGQNTTPQNGISISGGPRARKIRPPFIDQDRQGCSRQEDQLSTSSIVESAGAASRRQQASSGHRDADEA
jgi:hypothetical protein